jgi:hypothetical protein
LLVNVLDYRLRNKVSVARQPRVFACLVHVGFQLEKTVHRSATGNEGMKQLKRTELRGRHGENGG